MEFKIEKSGMLTTVQDLGRWGHQSDGVPVAGAMDIEALRFGNALLGNDENAAALEVTILGPEITIIGEGLVVFAGAELDFSLNGETIGSWKTVAVKSGDVISFDRPKKGSRGYLCCSGGIDVPMVMGSRSTYTRAKIGGYKGRALKSGDQLQTGEPYVLWRRLAGFTLPLKLRPDYAPERKLKIISGLQEDSFTKEGLETLFSSEYTISAESDRMGSRLDGSKVQHGVNGADIVSDGIPMGAVQIPGHGAPIVLLADRQTTGGYTKVGVLSPASIQTLVQRMPGSKVRFERAVMQEAIAELRRTQEALSQIALLRSAFVSAVHAPAPTAKDEPIKFWRYRLTVDGETNDVSCEELE